MKNKIRLGILGGGGDSLIGIVHRIASSMHDKYEIIGGVFNPDFSENLKFAEEIGLNKKRIYEDYEKMIEEELKLDENERIQVVSILTPNFLHYPMAKKLLENNFNVICEKPMTTTYEEAKDLEKIYKSKKLTFAVTYTCGILFWFFKYRPSSMPSCFSWRWMSIKTKSTGPRST